MDETRIDTLTIEIGASSDKATREIDKLSSRLKNLKDKSVRVNVDSKSVGTANKRISLLSKTLSSLKRVAFYRLIRTALKEVGEAFREGQENAYWYSKTVGEETKYISEAYDNLASASFKMKNQLGAAWATLRTAITPVLLEIVSLITTAANAITQFFAVLSGKSTYLKAIDYAKDWAEATDSGSKSAKEWKNQLLGFDVINRLEEPSSGGGGGASALPDYENMFEETDVSPWAEKIKPVLEWIKDHMDLIRDVAIGIGVALAAWKLGSFVADLGKALSKIGWIGKLAKVAIGLGIAVAGTLVYVQGFIDAWKNGPDWANIAKMIGGVAIAAIGLGIAFGPVAAGIALIVGGVGMLVVGLKDWITTGELSTETFWLLEAGIAAVGIGLALLTGSWIPLAIAAVVGIGLAIYKNWEKIKEWTNNAWEKVKEVFGNVVDGAKKFVTQTIPTFFNRIVDWFKSLPGKIGYWMGFALGKLVAWGENAVKWVKEEVPKIINNIVEFFMGLPGKIREKLDEFRQTLSGWVSSAKTWIDEELPQIINNIVDWFTNLPDAMVTIGKNLITGLWNGILSVGNWLWDKVSGFFGGLWDSVSGFFSGFGSGIAAGYQSVPKYASGGFPEDGFFYANHNELVGRFSNGRTAVANNEEITEGISKAVYNAVVSAFGHGSSSGGDDNTVNIYLDGKQIAQTTTRYQRQFARVGNA